MNSVFFTEDSFRENKLSKIRESILFLDELKILKDEKWTSAGT